MLKRCRNLYLIKQKTEKTGKELYICKVNRHIMESLASKLKDSIIEIVDNINKNPEIVMFTNGLVIKKKEMWAENLTTKTIPLNLRNLT